MSREEKSKIIRPLIKKGLKNKEIAERTGIPIGTVNGLSGAIRKELKNPVQAELTVINAGHASIATVMQVAVITVSIPEKNVVVMWKCVIRQWQEKD